jgi:tetratricopeptide (TPR) repeat protein
MQTQPLDAAELRQHAANLYRDGRLDESAAVFEELAASPDPVEGHHGLAVVALRRGDADGATHHLLEVLRRDPRHAGSLYWLGCIAESRGAIFEALMLYRATLANEPTHPFAATAAERVGAAEPARSAPFKPGGVTPMPPHAGSSPSASTAPPPPHPVAGPAPQAVTSPSRGKGVRGVVADLAPFQQQAWNTGRFKQGFNFRLITPEGEQVEVEIRGQKIYGRLRVGDDVEVLSGYMRRGLIAATRLYNHSSQSEITRRII